MISDGTDRLGFLLHDAARLMRRRFEKRAGEHGLSSAQWRVLVMVGKSEGISQARLASLLEIEPISVSRLLDRMEAGGWIERRPDAADRRVRTVFPTERSREVFGAIKAVAAQIFEEALAGLSPDERRATLNGLAAIARNLGEEPGDGSDFRSLVKQTDEPEGVAA